MRDVSAAFLAALPGSNLVAARVRLTHHMVRGIDGRMSPIGPALPLLDGTLTLDGTADERGRVDLEFAPYWPAEGQDEPHPATGAFATAADDTRPGRPVWPAVPGDNFAPYGSTLLVEAGVEFGGGSVEYVQLGHYRIDDMDQGDEPTGPIRVTCRDLMAFLIDSRMVYEQSFPAGTTMQTVFESLVIVDPLYGWRGMPLGFTPADLDLDPTFATLTLATSHTTDGERFAFLDDLVRSRGYIWYWDQFGKLKVTTAPDPATPVTSIAAGAGGTLLRAGRRLTREGAYSIVRVDSADVSATAMVRYVKDNTEGFETFGADHSPTNEYTFGFVPLYYSSPFVTNDAQAQTAAESRYAAVKGIPYRRTLTTVPNPALEPYDPVIVWPQGTEDQSTAEVHILETIRLPLVTGTSEITTKEWRLT
ncbi:MAG TPA: DUF5047 domain-containing protein [Mycobacteriales bacterium]|nr:DUF5047 domain-containing protein [Mycobacteriales bacterium]